MRLDEVIRRSAEEGTIEVVLRNQEAEEALFDRCVLFDGTNAPQGFRDFWGAEKGKVWGIRVVDSEEVLKLFPSTSLERK